MVLNYNFLKIHLILLILNIGSVWVFSINNEVVYDDSTSESFCPKSCYLFAFWSIILAYIFIPLITAFCLCFLLAIGLGFF